jgi:transcriptional regulator with XRE-family HTH domain
MRRILAGVSQERLAVALGVTFQQVQKYEKGANRVSASRLQQIGDVLGVPAAFFFDDAPNPRTSDVVAVDDADLIDLSSFMSSPEGTRLASAFRRIASARVRRRIIDLVEDLGEADVKQAD